MAGFTVTGIIPARVDSTRLPGKAMIKVDGVPLIGYVINRAKKIDGLNKLALATTERAVDRPLAEYAASEGLDVFTGDLHDVAGRMLACAKELGGDYFVRLNGDSPFPDPALVEEGLARIADGQADFVTNLVARSFPYGVAVEIVKTAAFDAAWPRMSSFEREHVTRYIYSHPEDFAVRSIASDYPELSDVRMVVDTEEDLELFKLAAKRLGDGVLEAGYRAVAETYLSLRSGL